MKDFLSAKNQERNKKPAKNSNLKFTLKLEIGWRHKCAKSNKYRQVKFLQGGGTRVKDFSRTATYETVFLAAQELFFPDGINKHKGVTTEEVDIFLGNYTGNRVEYIDGVEYVG